MSAALTLGGVKIKSITEVKMVLTSYNYIRTYGKLGGVNVDDIVIGIKLRYYGGYNLVRRRVVVFL